MKAYFICEEDVGDHSDIVHSCFMNIDDAIKAWSALEDDPTCDIPFYVMQADVENQPIKNQWYSLKLEPIDLFLYPEK